MRDIGTDDPRVHVRPGRPSKPRTKIRPDYSDRPRGQVITVDRGRYGVVMDDAVEVIAVKARELGRGALVVGDRVRLTGDLSGRKDTLARIVLIEERRTELTRSTDEGGGRERTIVANADQMAIVVALAQPEPKFGMIDRALVAAMEAGMQPLLVLTKADLASHQKGEEVYEPLGLRVFVTAVKHPAAPQRDDLEALREALTGHDTVLIGHSGVGKSTLFNTLVPDADRRTGDVNDVTGKGRHTSVNAVSFALPGGGRIIDTPGVRSFGLAHVDAAGLLRGFPDLEEVTADCPRGCTHKANETECALDTVRDPLGQRRVESLRRLLEQVPKPEWEG